MYAIRSYYAPFSSAKDPVNMAGYLAQNVLSGQLDIFTVKDLETLQPEQVLLDVRIV